MKTHNLATALRKLADILEARPNTELSRLVYLKDDQTSADPKEVAVNLRTLLGLSRIRKQEWVKLISEYGFEIRINPRDSARDIIGKLLRYLDSHPAAIDVLKKRSREVDKEPSALSQALDVLLGDV